MSRRRAQAHARRAHHCSCGRIVHGNGARAAHKAMHVRRGDGHRWLLEDAWLARFATDPRVREEALRRFRASYPGQEP